MTTLDVALLLLGASVGLTFAAHGAQKAFGWWGGPGIAGWRGSMAAMGFRPPTLFAIVSAGAELIGGLGLAIGFLTTLAAAVLVAQSVVIVFHVHWERGFWNTDRGFEFPLQLGIAALVLGLVGRGILSVDGLFANPAVLGIQGLHGLAPLDLLPPMTGRIALLLAGAAAGSIALAVPHLATSRHSAATERP